MEPEQINESKLTSAFSRYQAVTNARVVPIGVEAIHRAVYRRQRRRTAATGAFAAVALSAAAATYVLPGRSGMAPVAIPSTASPQLSSARPRSSAPTPSPRPSPSALPEGLPPQASFPPGAKPDLTAGGPGEVTLTPVGGRYEGVMTATLRNIGQAAYSFTMVEVTLPRDATFDFQGIAFAETGMNACGIQRDNPPMWECIGDPLVIPPQGQSTIKFRIIVNRAPQPVAVTLEGSSIKPVPYFAGRIDAPEVSENNNVHRFKLILAPS